MTIKIVPYDSEHEAEWEAFCPKAVNASILHRRSFLNYHGESFKDLSVLILKSGKLAGLFPAAESPDDSSLISSHPGITYGGVIHQGQIGGSRMVDVFTAISEHYKKSGYERLQYKPVPFVYTSSPSQDDLYALFRLKARRTRCYLSCAINLSSRRPLSERRRRGLKKSKNSVTLSSESALKDIWRVIEQNLERRYQAKPVHSLAELAVLRDKFPKEIIIRSALIDGVVVAGVIFFNSPLVWHAQYIAANEIGYDVSALDVIFDAAIHEAKEAGASYFDFGTSNEEGGWVLNEGLYRFKSEFGGGGVAHEYYELELN
jgi:hypothetical protein